MPLLLAGNSSRLRFAAEIDFDHPFVILHVVHRTIAENRALMEHSDFAARADLAHKTHVMLDHDDGVFPRERKEQFASAVRFLVGHAGGGFINQQQFGVLREQHPDFQPLLLTMGKGSGFPIGAILQFDGGQNFIQAIAFI